jgi:Flp pilus assembly protein TadD
MGQFKSVVFLGIACLTLQACSTSMKKDFGFGDRNAAYDKEQLFMRAQENALSEQYKFLQKGELTQTAEAYANDPQNPERAVDYASLLRKINNSPQAEAVLKPFAINAMAANANVLIEDAKIQLALGEFELAQFYAQQAQDIDAGPESQMILGIAKDAQGDHLAAQDALRTAYDKATLTPHILGKIKNNLAMSLIASGDVQEAVSILSSINSAGGMVDQGKIEGNLQLAQQL